MPATSNIIQGRLGLKQDMLCLDISQGCAGFVVGLLEAFMLLEQESIRKVVLAERRRPEPQGLAQGSEQLPADRRRGLRSRSSRRDERRAEILANLKMDGTQADVLIIPAGGFRCPSSPETAEMVEDENGNFRAKDHLVMKGDAVFNFVQVEVPPMIEALAGVGRPACSTPSTISCSTSPTSSCSTSWRTR